RPWRASGFCPGVVDACGKDSVWGVPQVDHAYVASFGVFFVGVGVGCGGVGWGEQGLDVLDDAGQEAEESEVFADVAGCLLCGVVGVVGGEGEGEGGVGFVEVGDVVDEGVLGAGVDVAEGGGESESEQGGVDDAVEARVGGGQGEVDGVLGVPVVGPVGAAGAADAVVLGVDLVEGLQPLAFHAAELVQGDGLGEVGVLEAHPVHADGDLEAALWVGPGGDLLFEPVGGEGVREDAGVGADAAGSDADDAGVVAGEGGQGRGGDGHPGAQQQAGQGCGGEVD